MAEGAKVIDFPVQPVKRALVIDDDATDRELVRMYLEPDWEVYEAEDGGEALSILNSVNVDVVLLDINLKRENGIELLEQIKNTYFNVETIMISVLDDVPTVVEAIKKGAFDYLVKGFSREDLRNRVEKAFNQIRLKKQIQIVDEEKEESLNILIGKNPKVIKIFETASQIARLPSTVLITGESGTGKEVLARYIHSRSTVADGPFIVVNVNNLTSELAESILFGHEKGAFTGALKRHFGKFELADGGTLFLDEIGDMPLPLQGKLLRVLQTGEFERVGGERTVRVRTRVIAATGKNLKNLVREGKFREDLFWRLNVIPFHMPPLRERKEDIIEFFNFFIDKFSKAFGKKINGIDEAVYDTLVNYPWPGNIRELENLSERLTALNETGYITVLDLPIEYYIGSHFEKGLMGTSEQYSLKHLVQEFERNLIITALKKAKGNQSLAAQLLGLARTTLISKIERYGLRELLEEK